MKCSNAAICWLLIQSYKLDTRLALVIKEHLLDLAFLARIHRTRSLCFLGRRLLWDVLDFMAGDVSSVFQCHRKAPRARKEAAAEKRTWDRGISPLEFDFPLGPFR